MDINTKALKKNAFRVTKERGMTASRIRVPGGHLDAKYFGEIQKIAEEAAHSGIEKGAVVILEPSTGRVLAMVSVPDYQSAR